MQLNSQQAKQCEENPYDMSGLKAVFINCTLKKSPATSHTDRIKRFYNNFAKRKSDVLEA